jgi:predicted PurR-regulated permease PerM
MKSPFRQILLGGVRLAKSLTFWSIIIGLLLALETALVINVYNIFIEHGFYYTANTAVYKISLLLGAAILILLMSFYYIERDQNTKAQDITDKMIKAIDANTEELKKISIAIQQSYSQIELVAKLITVRSCFSLAINRLVEGSSPSSGASLTTFASKYLVKGLNEFKIDLFTPQFQVLKCQF